MLRTTILELSELAYRAYYNISFTPGKRRDQILKELNEELEADLQSLGDDIGNYEDKYISYVRNWLEKKSRCISVMITGPANFPVNRNQKANNAEDKAWINFRVWREYFTEVANRVPTPSPEDDMEAAIKRVDILIINQEKMKAANRIIRHKKKTDNEKIKEMVDFGISEDLAKKCIEPDCDGAIGFPSFTLTNNNATIKRLKAKIETIKKRIEVKTSFEPITFEGGVINIENDRVTINHDEKPEQEVINKIKARGFRWSRNYGCWSRKHTARALLDAKQIIGVEE